MKQPSPGSAMRIGVMGTPCGATGYTAARLRAGGLDIGHERLRADGMVCGLWTLPHAERHRLDQHRPVLEDYTWMHHAIVVRHPLLVAQTAPAAMQSRPMPWSLEDLRLTALRYWVLAHEAALEQLDDPTILRIGRHTDADFAELAKRLQISDVDPGASRSVRNLKTRRWPPLTWATWEAADPGVTDRGRSLVDRYDLSEEG